MKKFLFLNLRFNVFGNIIRKDLNTGNPWALNFFHVTNPEPGKGQAKEIKLKYLHFLSHSIAWDFWFMNFQ